MRSARVLGCLLLIGVIVALPWAAQADCAADCVSRCDGKTGKDYENCMVPCIQDCQKNDPPPVPAVPPPTPVKPSKDGGS